jgi:tetratricopeptide (TPR) repeat protein
MSDIFISYANEDRLRARMFVQALEGRGWSVFWDRTIPVGKTWRETIGEELSEARCVIVLWSTASVASDWVQEEADDAKRRGILVPVLVENVHPPIGFRNIQTADLVNWDPTVSTQAFGILTDGIAALIHLAGLAPASILPRDPKMIGREGRLEELVTAILEQDRPIIVPGALGMGKTTLALAAAHDARVVARYGGRRVFVNLEPILDGDGLLRRLAADLGVEPKGAAPQIEASITAACGAASALAILDNLETPWLKNRAAIEALLERIGGIPGLRLVITVRGEVPHIPGAGTCNLPDVSRLLDPDDRALFLRHGGDHFASDPSLPGLLRDLEGHPLLIELLAANAAGKENLKGLSDDWKGRRLQLSGDHRLRASLDLSLEALGVGSAAHRLLRLMALLPDGLSEVDSLTILSDGEPSRDERGASSVLETARLASRPDGRWRLLSPVRALLEDVSPEPKDRARIVKVFLEHAALGTNAETNDVSKRLTAEAGNLDAMIAIATRETPLPAGLSRAVRGLAEFHRHTGLASTTSLTDALRAFRRAGDQRNEAICIQSLGDIALARSDHLGASQRYKEAISVYRSVDDDNGRANCIRSLGDIAVRRFDFGEAERSYWESFLLYENVRDKAGCIERFGDIALARSDYKGARLLYEAALEIFKREGYKLGEAGCIRCLGDVALRRSEFNAANECYREASKLYEQIGDKRGEIGCIERRGDIALRCCDLEQERSRYDQGQLDSDAGLIKRLSDAAQHFYDKALRLYEEVGDAMGQAGCVKRLGDVALNRHELDEAQVRYVSAEQHFKQIGDARGQAACIERFGDIALARSEYVCAGEHYEAAKSLFQHDDLGKANCIRGLGDIHEGKEEYLVAGERWREALDLYSKNGDPFWIGTAHIRLARRAATREEAAKHREAALRAWASIDRLDPLLGSFGG